MKYSRPDETSNIPDLRGVHTGTENETQSWCLSTHPSETNEPSYSVQTVPASPTSPLDSYSVLKPEFLTMFSKAGKAGIPEYEM